MCECGCGDFNCYEAYTIGDYVLAFEIYPGCVECKTGIMFSVYIFTLKEAEFWGIKPKGEFAPDESGCSRLDFPLIGQEDLVSWAEKNKIDENGCSIADYETLSDYLQGNGLKLLQGGLFQRLDEIKKTKGGEE